MSKTRRPRRRKRPQCQMTQLSLEFNNLNPARTLRRTSSVPNSLLNTRIRIFLRPHRTNSVHLGTPLMAVLPVPTIALVHLVASVLVAPEVLQVHSQEATVVHLDTVLKAGTLLRQASTSLLVRSLLACLQDLQHNKDNIRIKVNHHRVPRARHQLVHLEATSQSPTRNPRSRRLMVLPNPLSPRPLPNLLARLQHPLPLPNSPLHLQLSLSPMLQLLWLPLRLLMLDLRDPHPQVPGAVASFLPCLLQVLE